MENIKFLFGLERRVNRRQYLTWGIALMVAKYLCEAALYWQVSGELLSPLAFLSPATWQRYSKDHPLPDWFLPLVAVGSVPFVWVGLSMSVRRFADAGRSPWWGLLFLMPGFNYMAMIAGSLLPTSEHETWSDYRTKQPHERNLSLAAVIFLGVVAGALYTWFCTNFLRSYGGSLFLISPLILGMAQGFYLNFSERRSMKYTALIAVLTVFFTYFTLFLFSLEGAMCLAMAFPLAASLALMGSLLGGGIARYGRTRPRVPVMMVVFLPAMPLIESSSLTAHQDVVLSVVEIEAPPTKVWPNVVKFSDLPPATEWLFKLGVAHPIRARIEGSGVGAIRHCEFTTGAFVEPITQWNEPHYLAFNVASQPQPMKELSLYDHVHAPHLDGYFRSLRGEFRLVPLATGGTRLEGRTWYEMDMHPGWYWQTYSRWLIHKIHHRVLVHIKALTEEET